jgi:transcriptional regulator with XRE-family HTH domain
MSISNRSTGKRIANTRKAVGLTQAELSEKIGISEKYLSRIECGKQVPSIVIVARICEALCVSADKLLSLNQSTTSNSRIQNEIADFSIYEQEEIIKIIKIIKEIKNQP